MGIRFRAGAVAAFLALAATAPGRAMDFTPVRIDSTFVIIVGAGEIAPGDSDRLMGVLVTLPVSEDHLLGLNSPGGSVVASQSLAATIKQSKLPVMVADNGTCASACFVLYAASPRKLYMPGARIGVHSASSPNYETPASMAMTTVMARVLADMGVPDAIVGRMIRTPPGSMAWLSDADLASIGAIRLDPPSKTPSPPVASVSPPPPTFHPPTLGQAGSVATLGVPTTSGTVPADPTSASYQRGLSDRTAWERWFGSLTGDYRNGAEFWSRERSKPRPSSCDASIAEITRGCLEAKRLLTGADIARKTDRQYWWGWNSYATPAVWDAIGQPVTGSSDIPFDDLIPRRR